tara:strand:+ start:675 stop:1268 length:594 start_codon:yes stop_codon:yes gene_type:complete
MAINISIGNNQEKVSQPDPPRPPDIKVEFKGPEKDNLEFQLKLRSALNGDLMILDHKDIDIIIQPKNNKVLTIAKDMMTDAVYGAESRLLEYLRKKGVIEYDSIQGGNIYGSLEGKIMESTQVDAVKATILNISEWMETEQPYIKGTTAYEEMEDDLLLNPDNFDSTDLGQVPQAPEKGSIEQDSIFAPYIYGRYTY